MPVLLASRITPGDMTIESADVLKRIVELEDLRVKEAQLSVYKITRNRNGENLFTPSTLRNKADAVAYLDSRDYDQTRFNISRVRGPEFSEDDKAELIRLQVLNDTGRSEFGSQRWITDSVQLLSDDFCDSDWARQQAVERLKISTYRLDEWPFNNVDWGELGGELLESEYTQIDFNGFTYWGKSAE